MSISQTVPIIIFVFSMSITPGPNNIMLTTSGAVFGFVKTIPHILGIIFGILCLNIFSSLGLNNFFRLFPMTKEVLKILGVLYMFYLSFKIMTSKGLQKVTRKTKPFTFFQGALFQILNPKAVLMSITAMSVFTNSDYILSSITIILIFIIIGTPSISVWAYFGDLVGNILKVEKYGNIFKYIMGVLTGATGLFIIF